MSSTEASKFKYYHYDPSLALPIVAVVLFAIVTAVHGWLMARTRAWFLIPLIVGGLCTSTLSHHKQTVRYLYFFLVSTVEVGGFAARAVSATQTPDWALLPYIMQVWIPQSHYTLYRYLFHQNIPETDNPSSYRASSAS